MIGDWGYMNDETRDIDSERRDNNKRLRRKQNRTDVDVNLLVVTNVDEMYRCWRGDRVSIHSCSLSHFDYRRMILEIVFVILETIKISLVLRL